VGSSTPFSGTGCPVGLDELSHGAPAAGHGLDAERAHAHGQALADDLLLLRLVQLATGRVCGPSIPGISGGTAAGGSASAQLDDVDASAV
jgi:hypothetical protein